MHGSYPRILSSDYFSHTTIACKAASQFKLANVDEFYRLSAGNNLMEMEAQQGGQDLLRVCVWLFRTGYVSMHPVLTLTGAVSQVQSLAPVGSEANNNGSTPKSTIVINA
jgi:hypothetical protein